MEVAMPVAGASSMAAMDCYEDMFKEITRKLYGEDGLPDLASGERLTGITTSAERGMTGIDYDVETPIFKPEEHITAFGLAALMQNGFPPPGILNSNFQQSKQNQTAEDKWIASEDNLQWTQSKIASYNPSQKLFKCAECDCVGFLARVAEHWLGTHANLRVFQCPQCPYASAWARCVRMHLSRQHNVATEETNDTFLKENPVLHEITRYLQKLKIKLETNCSKPQMANPPPSEDYQSAPSTSVVSSRSSSTGTQNSAPVVNNGDVNNTNSSAGKRYSCTYCPYATDRRDLFTRHENIHREEKPFQCYVCQKQFNRADHVKKHFLRMHREHPYDLNRIRRHPPKNASGMSYYHKYNANGTVASSSSSDNLNNVQNMQHPLSIPNSFGNVSRVGQTVSPIKPNGSSSYAKPPNLKSSSSKSSSKKKGDKRYSCCYCSWSGVDNWCLKRHLNTHLKPFICSLCDYKAARSERLATHVLKVHNKRACGRCLFLADDQTQLASHQQEHHPLEQRNNRSSNSVLRNTSFNNITPPAPTFSSSQALGHMTPGLKPYELSAAAAILQHGSRLLPMTGNIMSTSETKPWKPYTPKQHGAARLFNYMEASDGSETECDTTSGTEDMTRLQANSRNQSDFLEAGDVGHHHQGEVEEDIEEELELPLFICNECGCEFVDDTSLETHQYTHHRVEKITTSPANKKINKPIKKIAAKPDIKAEVNMKSNYKCCVCKKSYNSQQTIMSHMKNHISLNNNVNEESDKKHDLVDSQTDSYTLIKLEGDTCNHMNGYQNNQINCKRSRKQSQPRKVLTFWDTDEIQMLRQLSGKLRKWSNTVSGVASQLREKYITHLVTRNRLSCTWCKNNEPMFPYHTRSSLILHHYWRHTKNKKFQCEHCTLKFHHRYQVVLHSSREHVKEISADTMNLSRSTSESNLNDISQSVDGDKQTVPKLQSKEPILHKLNMLAPEDIQTSNTVLTTNVPDISTSSPSIIGKLGMHPYTEQSSFINQNNHIPIVIPTFPPS